MLSYQLHAVAHNTERKDLLTENEGFQKPRTTCSNDAGSKRTSHVLRKVFFLLVLLCKLNSSHF
jgi:hypothetical protein